MNLESVVLETRKPIPQVTVSSILEDYKLRSLVVNHYTLFMTVFVKIDRLVWKLRGDHTEKPAHHGDLIHQFSLRRKENIKNPHLFPVSRWQDYPSMHCLVVSCCNFEILGGRIIPPFKSICQISGIIQ